MTGCQLASCPLSRESPVAERKPFLLRLDPALFEALQRWANDDLRSLNGQIEFLLRDALRKAGRLAGGAPPPGGRLASGRDRREDGGARCGRAA